MAGGIFQDFNLFLYFWFLYIKRHVSSNFYDEILKKGLVEHPFPFWLRSGARGCARHGVNRDQGVSPKDQSLTPPGISDTVKN